MFRRLVLVLLACVAPLVLALSLEAGPLFAADPAIADLAAAPDADTVGSVDAAEPAAEAIEDDVAAFEPSAIRAPSDPRERISYEPGEAIEPRPPGRAVLTRPPV